MILIQWLCIIEVSIYFSEKISTGMIKAGVNVADK